MRLYVALLRRDGQAEIVNASRPASLIAFSDAHEGKDAPENQREIAWLVHHSLGIEEDLEAWLQEIEDLSPAPEDLKLAQAIIAGETTLAEALEAEMATGGSVAEIYATQNGDAEPEPDPTPAIPGEVSSPA